MMMNKRELTTRISYIFPFMLAFYEVIIYLSNDAYLPALTLISDDFKSTHQFVQLTLTAWFIGSASVQLLVGLLADRFGRRPVLLFGGLVFIGTCLGCSLATNLYYFIFLRFLQGATVTSMVVAGYSTIHDLFEDEKAIHMIAMMTSIVILAPAFGPLCGALILSALGWRCIFSILALLGILAILYLYFTMPETKAKIFPMPKVHEIFSYYLKILSNKSFILHVFIAQIFFGIMTAWITAGPFLVIDKYGFTPIQFSLFQILIFGTFILAARFVNKLIAKFTFSNIIRNCTFFCLIVSFCGVIFSFIFQTAIWIILLMMIVFAIAVGFSLPILNRLAIQASEESMAAKVAIWSCLISLSAAIYSALISFLSLYFGIYFALVTVFFISSTIAFLLSHFFVSTTEKSLLSQGC